MYVCLLLHCYTYLLFQEKINYSFDTILQEKITGGSVNFVSKTKRQFYSEFYQNKVMQYEALTFLININSILNPWSLRYGSNGF